MAFVLLTLYVQFSVVTNCPEVNYSFEASLKSGIRFPNLLGANHSVVTSFKKTTLI